MKKVCAGILAFFLFAVFAGCSSNSRASSEYSNTNSSESKSQEAYSDDMISMSFEGKHDAVGLQGMFSIDIKAENKSSEEITVYLQDVYINDTMATVGSGTPLDLLPGKSNAQSFVGKYDGTGISTADEIKKIGFKILVMDKSAKTLETTKAIEINF